MRPFFFITFVIFVLGCKSTKTKLTVEASKIEYAIAYNIGVKDSDGKTNYEVFTMNLDGTNSKNITAHKDVAWTYRAFKHKLFFISDRDTCYRCFFLYETDVNGFYLRKVSKLRIEDSWMDIRNNGGEIIVSGRIGKEIRYQLFAINTADGSYKQITNDTAAYFRDPAFSPDGKKIAFVFRKNKRDKSINDEIYIMNAAGGEMQQLTHYPKDNISYRSNGYKAGAVHWHPNGDFISYISMQNERHNIYAVTADGKKQWKLTSHEYSEGWHDWSSDGQWLTFDTSNADESQYHIMLMNWKTKEVKQLTDTIHRFQQSPVFLWK